MKRTPGIAVAMLAGSASIIEFPGVHFVFFGKGCNFISGFRYDGPGNGRPPWLPPLITYMVSVE